MYNFNCSGLVEIQEIRESEVKEKNLIVIKKANGKLYKTDSFSSSIFPQLKVQISGVGNLIILEEPIFFRNSTIQINSNNNIIKISPTKRLVILNVCITDGNNQSLVIGKDFSCGKTSILMHEEFSHISFGEDCMLSADILILNSDCHHISFGDKENINISSGIFVGNHVWIGRGASLFKNARLGDGCILGAFSVLSKGFSKANCVIAGNPAKIIKSNVFWSRESVSKQLQANKDKYIQQLNEKIYKYNKLREQIFNK